jgi:hypothetical protein
MTQINSGWSPDMDRSARSVADHIVVVFWPACSVPGAPPWGGLCSTFGGQFRHLALWAQSWGPKFIYFINWLIWSGDWKAQWSNSVEDLKLSRGVAVVSQVRMGRFSRAVDPPLFACRCASRSGIVLESGGPSCAAFCSLSGLRKYDL